MMRPFEFFAPAESPDSEVPTLRIADRFPNVSLQNQCGDAIRFRNDFVESGRALIINSVYTTCRGSCPGTSAMISKLRKSLYPVFGRQLVFLSFTLEPLVDDVPTLSKYGERYSAGIGQPDRCDWHFLTGTQSEIERLRMGLGFFDLNPRVDRDITQHGSSLLIGNPEKDRWCAVTAELPERVLIDSIRRTAGFTFEQKYGFAS